jgi:hypothetical protein
VPATPLFVHNLRAGIEILEGLPQDWIDRRTLQDILGVSKWTAWRILKRCGAQDGPGSSLVCRRAALISKLKAFREGIPVSAEISRRDRVERYLEGMGRYVRARNSKVAQDGEAAILLGSRLLNLPPGVELEPGELRIRFSGASDFLQKFGAVVFALQNDFDRIRELLDSAGDTVEQ